MGCPPSSRPASHTLLALQPADAGLPAQKTKAPEAANPRGPDLPALSEPVTLFRELFKFKETDAILTINFAHHGCAVTS